MKIKIGYYKRFGRFEVLGSLRLRLSNVLHMSGYHWFALYKDKAQKHKCAAIQLSFELPNKSSCTTSDSVSAPRSVDLNSNDAVCSDYLIQMVNDLRVQVEERDQKIKTMQAYIDQMLTRILQNCPQLLEK